MGRFQSSEADSNGVIYRSEEETKVYVDSCEASSIALGHSIMFQ